MVSSESKGFGTHNEMHPIRQNISRLVVRTPNTLNGTGLCGTSAGSRGQRVGSFPLSELHVRLFLRPLVANLRKSYKD